MQENFYTTDSEALGGLMGLYSTVLKGGVRENFIVRNEACSDLLTYKPVAAAEAVSYVKYILTSERVNVVGSWNHCYSVINGSNAYIRSLSDNENISKDKREQYIKEARFFRALMYYHLVMRWGDVPLRTTPTNMKNTDIARSPADEVWSQVIEDLTEASSLPEKSNTPNGRISRGLVYTLLAKVYLIKKDYQNAANTLDKITGYSLMSNINDVWNIRQKYNKESIWEINCEPGTLPKQDNFMLSFYLPVYPDFKGTNATYPVNDYLLMLTEQNSPRSKYFYSKKIKTNEVTSTYKGEYEYTDASGKNVKIIFTNATMPAYAHLMKFADLSNNGTNFETGNSPFNIIIFRYADVLLMQAEAECELNGKTAKALEYLNLIRKRAGETLYTITNESGLRPLNNQEDMREAIRNERALELVGEGHRFYDLKRWGNQYALTKLRESRQAHIAGTNFCYNPEDLTNIEEHKLLWPIPEEEMRGNKLMIQNDKY
ncbi:hypothetical protein FACS1894203_0010 [Bacteroidia bacterium]|nr:hypothetical protein FACS1894203_0010 [Bacteroidia bacterium]